MFGYVVGGEFHGSGLAVDSKYAISVNGVDGPLVAVTDRATLVRVNESVVAAGDDQIADIEPVVACLDVAAC